MLKGNKRKLSNGGSRSDSFKNVRIAILGQDGVGKSGLVCLANWFVVEGAIWDIYIQHFVLPHLNHCACLLMLSGQTLLISPSFTCSFFANFQLNKPRPAPIWSCSSVVRACNGDMFRPARVRIPGTGVRYFSSFSVWAHFLSRAIAQNSKVSFGIFIQHFST